jgi:hypothetical protein
MPRPGRAPQPPELLWYAVTTMRQRARAVAAGAALRLSFAVPGPARAQDNYEIQVYGSELVPAGDTMVEFHSNSLRCPSCTPGRPWPKG